jgi:hypothetical protein
MDTEYFFEVFDRIYEISSRSVYESGNALDREIWIRRVVRREKFSAIAADLFLDPGFVSRQWYRILNRVADEIRLQAIRDRRIRVVLGKALNDPDSFRNILAGLLSIHFPPGGRRFFSK